MDLFEMLQHLTTMTNAFFAATEAIEGENPIVEIFMDARDKAAEWLVLESQMRERLN